MIRVIKISIAIIGLLILFFVRKRIIEPNKDNNIIKNIYIAINVAMFLVICMSLLLIFFF